MKKHQLFSFILAIVLMVSAIPISVNAEDEYEVITRLQYPGVPSLGNIDIIWKMVYTDPYTNRTSVSDYLMDHVNLISRDTEIVIVDSNDKDKVDIRWCVELYPCRINSEGKAELIGDLYRLRNGKVVKVTDDTALTYQAGPRPDDVGKLDESGGARLQYDDDYDKIHAGETMRFHLPFEEYNEPVLFIISYEVVYSRSHFVENDFVYFRHNLYAADAAVKALVDIPSNKDYSLELTRAGFEGEIVNIVNGERTFDDGYGYYATVTNNSEYYNLDAYFALAAVPKSSSDRYYLAQINYFYVQINRNSSKTLPMSSNFPRLSVDEYDFYIIDFDDLDDLMDFAENLNSEWAGIENMRDGFTANTHPSYGPHSIYPTDSNAAFLKSKGIGV